MEATPGTLGIGERLRNAREAKRLTLEAAARHTRIRPAYLQALEDEEFAKLPGPIYAKGFLRAYAEALGLNSDELVAVYPAAFAAPPASLVGRPAEIPIRPVAPPSRLRRVLTYVAVVLLLILAGLGYVGYEQWSAFNAPVGLAPAPPAARPSPFEDTPMAAVPRPTPVAPAPVAPPAPAPVAPPRPPVTAPAAPAAAISLAIRATATTWVRVTSDGRRLFEGMLRAGETRSWTGSRLTVRLGNAPAAVVEVNGRRIPTPAGLRVWQQTFTAP
jgi:cytoskeletal protein RodZ